MADNCSVLDPWMYEAFARDNAALTRALQISISSPSNSSTTPSIPSPDCATSPFPLLRSPPAAVSDRRRPALAAAPAAKVAKRKSRASKRSPTTYITADPENFREMVQRVTGGRLGCEPVFEPVRRADRPVQQMVGCLPTLDTSSFLLDQAGVEPVEGGFVEPVDEPGFDFEALLGASFPTLESWGVM